MSYSDADLRAAVDAVFDAFDKDKSGFLEPPEVHNLINAALQHMGKPQITQEQTMGFIKEVDTSKDGRIEKRELYDIFKRACQ